MLGSAPVSSSSRTTLAEFDRMASCRSCAFVIGDLVENKISEGLTNCCSEFDMAHSAGLVVFAALVVRSTSFSPDIVSRRSLLELGGLSALTAAAPPASRPQQQSKADRTDAVRGLLANVPAFELVDSSGDPLSLPGSRGQTLRFVFMEAADASDVLKGIRKQLPKDAYYGTSRVSRFDIAEALLRRADDRPKGKQPPAQPPLSYKLVPSDSAYDAALQLTRFPSLKAGSVPLFYVDALRGSPAEFGLAAADGTDAAQSAVKPLFFERKDPTRREERAAAPNPTSPTTSRRPSCERR